MVINRESYTIDVSFYYRHTLRMITGTYRLRRFLESQTGKIVTMNMFGELTFIFYGKCEKTKNSSEVTCNKTWVPVLRSEIKLDDSSGVYEKFLYGDKREVNLLI